MAASKLALLESRIAALEVKMKQLEAQKHLKKTAGEDWITRIDGSFADDPGFDELVQLGKEYRESLRPKPAKKKSAKATRKRSR